MAEGIAHKELKKKVMEIGKFEGYRVEKEVSLVDEFKVDVVWYKTPGRSPKYAFEIVSGSSVTNPLSSLKTALDEWNCKRVIIIADGQKLRKARHLLETTYAEMAPDCSLIDSERIHRLREITNEYHRIKSSIGYQTYPT